MKILYIAEIVGKAGVWAVKQILPKLQQTEKFDLVIGNCDGATGGSGLGKNHAVYLQKLGIDVITGGDFIYYKKDLVADLDTMSKVIRPLNLPLNSPGRGFKILTRCGVPVVIVSLLGHSGNFRIYGDNPFVTIKNFLEKPSNFVKNSDFNKNIKYSNENIFELSSGKKPPVVLVDFHAGATAEKEAFFYAIDGKVSAVFGSHGRVQTTDERVLEGGTAVICDAGRTGSQNSVGGLDGESCIREYITQIPDWSRETWDSIELQGVVVNINENLLSYGKAVSIERIKLFVQQNEQSKQEI